MSYHRQHEPSVLALDRAWFNVALPLKSCSLKELATLVPTKEQLDQYFQEAQGALDNEIQTEKHDKGRWYMQQFQTRGTVSDKVASAAVKLTDFDFMFFMDGFNLLFETARTDSHHFDAALKALGAVWSKLLPPRPLKKFAAQHFATLPAEGSDRRKVLVYWYLEDHLKRTYGQFLSLCEGMLKDRVQHRREAWLELAGKLLLSVAESRHVMIAMIVDKLGDPMPQIGHKAYHDILGMLTESSTNQQALLTELEKLAFTKNCPVRAMRFCVNIMSQFVFNKEERKLALKCVQTYLGLFRELVMSERVEQSVTSAIITGIRRAFPYSGTDYGPLSQHLDALFVLANTASFLQRVSTLSLLQHLINKGTPSGFTDRWFRALYQCLLVSPKQLPNASQLSGLFSMLHKALRSDTNSERVCAFVQRLLQRSLFFSEAFICAVLLLVGELIQTNAAVKGMLHAARNRGAAAAAAAYDPKHRDPQYAHASNSLIWTLNLYAKHSHPAVVKLAVLILFEEELAFDSHPLDDLTLPNFLQMFVDAKTDDEMGGRSNGGVPVFRRAVHAPNIPSASDEYFVSANPEAVDVGAIFLHRYAVQRQRFLQGLQQVRSTWGEASGEEEVPAAALTSCDALFGPEGGIAAAATAEPGSAKKITKTKGGAIDSDNDEGDNEEHEDVAYSDSEGASDAFDADPDEADLDWGSDDDAACEDMEASTDEDASDDGEEEVLGRKRKHVAGDVEADEFGEIIDQHKQKTSKKQQLEEKWLDRATNSRVPPRGAMERGRGAGFRGRGRGSFVRGGRK